jgi:CHASE2 domain-containing sensor protein
MPAQRLLVGPGFDAHAAPTADARVVSAALLLDPEIARDDAALFHRRVVVIGATHPGSGDFWLTPSGVRPGVEMVANSIRYAPVQRSHQSLAQRLGYRALALFLFGTFIFFERKLRALPATILTVGVAFVTIAIVMSVAQSLALFDALEAAILLIVLYKALDVIGESINEVCRTRERFGPGWKGWRKTAATLCRRES